MNALLLAKADSILAESVISRIVLHLTTYFRLMYAITFEVKPEQLEMRKCINKVIRRNFEKTLLRTRSWIKLSSSLTESGLIH